MIRRDLRVKDKEVVIEKNSRFIHRLCSPVNYVALNLLYTSDHILRLNRVTILDLQCHYV